MRFTHSPSADALNAVAIDSTSGQQPISRQKPYVGAYVWLLLFMLATALHARLVGYVVGSLFASTAYQFYPYFLVPCATAFFGIAQ